ncbi:hypothetical protein ABZ816_20705 [Actinosynnema sp. NPDC047251]|uniref:Uncharacterized protein n=1 Tax=Saccharothrix espanaensis (strain ATCC 51144 / DSM 44229 / JCM 9112 / NBRC 15066 / NRRL 15764) TaxID=1179773 RepID=K0K404_SACES|nr:hypothetical protein [Saccharothrix espanaensis]CCH34985.1 hypothetical protein BN6_77650 [Saccharothrix espanaensis DSM 44229]
MSSGVLLALIESKEFVTLVALVALWQLKVLVNALPQLSLALDRRRATREALRARTKAEREHARDVLRILQGDPPEPEER